MKKIGILTFHYENNYGAILQCYALQQIIKEKKYDVKIINFYIKNGINDSLKLINPNKNIIKQVITAPLNFCKLKKLKNFINNNLILTTRITQREEVIKYINNLDIVITGSDQVWNEKIIQNAEDIFLLNFNSPSTLKKCSYAASFGNSKLNDDFKKQLKKSLTKYSIVTTREESATRLLNELKIESKTVLDPTLLLTKEKWQTISKKYKNITTEYILVYSMEKNEDLIKIAKDLSMKLKLKVIHFRKEKTFENLLYRAYDAGIEEFIYLFKNANYVVTNSFHGLVFSIIFNKEFVSINHKTRNERQENLLLLTKLTNRAVQTYDDYINTSFDKINYDKVNKLIEETRKESFKCIDEIVGDNHE